MMILGKGRERERRERATIESFEKNYQLRHTILHHFCNSSYHTTKSEIAGSSFQLRSRVIKWCIDVMTDECSDMHLCNCIAAYFYRTERIKSWTQYTLGGAASGYGRSEWSARVHSYKTTHRNTLQGFHQIIWVLGWDGEMFAVLT